MKTYFTSRVLRICSLLCVLGSLVFVPAMAAAQLTGDTPSGGGTPSTLDGSSWVGWPPAGSGETPSYPKGQGPGTINPGSAPSSTSGQTAYCYGVGTTLQLGNTNLSGVIKYITCLVLDSIVPLLFAIAFAVFIWGMVKFISTAEAAEKEQGRQFMIWGVVALAVMFSVWGLVRILTDTFGVANVVPMLPTDPNG